MSRKLDLFESVLTKSYQHDAFVDFVREFLNSVSMVAPMQYRTVYSNFSYYVEGYYHIGNYQGNDSEKIAIFSVGLRKGESVQRARTMQRNFMKPLIENGNCAGALVAFYTPEEPEKWRLSFIRLDYEFSKGKVTEKLTPAKRYSYLVGKGEPCNTAKQRLFPIFRDDENNPSLNELEDAFSVEKVTNEFFQLYCEKFHELREYLESNDEFMQEAHIRNFTSEQFAKKLLGQIVFLYFIQKKGWLGVGAIPIKMSEKEYHKAYWARGEKSRAIISQLYALQEDGSYRIIVKKLQQLSDEDEAFLAGIVKGKPWGTGPKDFMRQIFDDCKSSGQNYFDDYLEPLFYTGLNKNRGENGFFPLFHRRIPFLNGGLFEQLDNYEWENNNFNIPNSIFSNKDEKEIRTADGILDIFDRYNFTMNEDEPMEREVAIDPEMLGKVFENLLDVKDRKSKGAFYTPREIVHYMCQETLINYLVSKTEISEASIRDFILYGEYMRAEDTSKTLKVTDASGQNYYKINKNKDMLISEQIFSFQKNINRLKELDDLLANVKVADLAVGSGAFPLGMLNEIVRVREVLTEYLTMEMNGFQKRSFCSYGRTPYDLKVNTIKNCIFACDIEPSAVDIAKLRLWLSIVIDDEVVADAGNGDFGEHTKPKQLPNLDCNIICGNSLVDEFQGKKLITESVLLNNVSNNSQNCMFQSSIDGLISKLIELQDKLFFTKEHNDKEEIKQQIQNIYNDIILENFGGDIHLSNAYLESLTESSKPFILWQLYFPKVFRDNGGFDIVIGNPPYVQLQKFRNTEFQNAVKRLNFSSYSSKGDIYCLFYEKGIKLLNPRGVECFITSNKWMRADYGKNLRNLFLCYSPIFLIDLGSGVFDTATVDTNILLLSKERGKNLYTVDYSNEDLQLSSIRSMAQRCSFSQNEVWYVGDNILQIIKEKVEKTGKPLKQWEINIKCGFKTGLNEAFIVDNNTKELLCLQDLNSGEILAKNLRGKDVRGYSLNWQGLWLIVAKYGFYKEIDKYPAIKEHLSQYEDKLKLRGQCKYTRGITSNSDYIGQHHWLELDNNPKEDIINMFSAKEKILFPDITKEPSFYYDTDQYYSQETVFAIIGKHLKYLTGVLNSDCVTVLYKTFYAGGGLGENGIRYKKKFLETLPIPIPSLEDEVYIEERVCRIQNAIKHNNTTEVANLKIEINERVIKLYGFTEKELERITGKKEWQKSNMKSKKS